MNARQAKKRLQKGEPTKNDLRRQLQRMEDELHRSENYQIGAARRVDRMQQERDSACQEVSTWRDRALAAEKLLNQKADNVMSYARQPFKASPSRADMELIARSVQIEGRIHIAVCMDFGGIRLHDCGQDLDALKENLVRRFTQKAYEHAKETIRLIRC